MGWRYLLYTLGALSFVVFFLRFAIFTFRETPKYLLYQGQDAKAIEVMQHMAEVNKQQCRLTVEHLQSLGRGSGSSIEDAASSDSLIPARKGMWPLDMKLERCDMLFGGLRMTRLTILVWLTYILDFSGFTVAGT